MRPEITECLSEEGLQNENRELRAKIAQLEESLAESNQTLAAIHGGEVDAILVSTKSGDQIFTLEGAEAPYRILFEQMNESAATISEDGEILYCNHSFARVMRTTLEKMIGTNLQIYVHISDAKRFWTLLKRSVSGPVHEDMMLMAKDGTLVPMQLSISYLATTEMPTFCLVLADLTERIQMEESLRRANEELDLKVKERTSALARSNNELQQFAYVASHDLQEPLRMVTAYLSLLEKKYGDKFDGQAREYMDFAIEGGTRARELVKDLLQLSQLESQAKPMSTTDMNSVMDVVTRNLAVQMNEEKAMVAWDQLPKIFADEAQMTALLQNLISNSIKFHGKKEPRIQVSCGDQGNQWIFAVKDNGIGIDPQFKEKIFVIFQRLHSHGEYAGTGIGLAIAKKIVERHDGRIWFDSVVGEGTTFYFTIPKRGLR